MLFNNIIVYNYCAFTELMTVIKRHKLIIMSWFTIAVYRKSTELKQTLRLTTVFLYMCVYILCIFLWKMNMSVKTKPPRCYCNSFLPAPLVLFLNMRVNTFKVLPHHPCFNSVRIHTKSQKTAPLYVTKL